MGHRLLTGHFAREKSLFLLLYRKEEKKAIEFGKKDVEFAKKRGRHEGCGKTASQSDFLFERCV